MVIGILCAAVIISAVSHERRGGRSTLVTRPLVRLGEWSYAFYLLHATLIYAVRAAVGKLDPSWGNLLWHVPILLTSLLAAAAGHHLVEKPVERRLRSAWDRRRAARASTEVTATATPTA